MSEIPLSEDGFDGEAPIADWFDAKIEKSVEQLTSTVLLGTLAIAYYQVGRADFEPATAELLLNEVDPTDDVPVRRGIYLYELRARAVNYVEQQVSSGEPAIWIEELSAGDAKDPWSGHVFGDVKTLAVNAVTGQTLHGQKVNALELEIWNTALLSSIPVNRETADLAVAIDERRLAVADRKRAPNPEAEQAAQTKLDAAIQLAVDAVRQAQEKHGIE